MSQTTPVEQLWRPTSFRTRGVAVPFTAPALAGARVRAGTHGLELVVPHPAGVRGVYILAWSKVATAYPLTVHDALLLDHIDGLPVIGPREIRHAARIVASGGAAGHAAQDAARAAQVQERELVQLTTAKLVQQLLTRTPIVAAGGDTSIVGRIAASLGCSGVSAAAAVERLAAAYARLGLGPADNQAPCRLALAAVTRLVSELLPLAGLGNEKVAVATNFIVAAAEATLLLARRGLDDAADKAADLPALMRTMVAAPPGDDAVLYELMRSDWALDGWDRICLVWRLAGEDGHQREALAELALMVPAIPKEAEAWGGVAVDPTGLRRLQHASQNFDAWRTGSAVFGLTARNERIRTLAA